MENEALAERFRAFVPVPWDALPDLGLYMDQVITYLERQTKPLFGGAGPGITPAMINNYVKSGLVDRPKGKKYEREQLAQLMMLCMLKRAVSLDAMKRLLAVAEGETVEALYQSFCAVQQQAVRSLADELPGATPLNLAVKTAAYQLLCAGISE